ncbi:MAG TPA: HEAT repeat domain-containing protein [Pyrinomonadaceae bacterium]|nr:HEAT repeat domain-containing protein [Pyrinomonadaceae bacterium]
MPSKTFFRHVGFAGLLIVALQAASMSQGRQGTGSLTPHQLEIAKQQDRLASGDAEERRDALSRLRSMRHPAASRVALTALTDASPIVRATAVGSILSLPPAESSASLIPLLSDKDEFVRRETAYALGRTRSRSAVPRLVELLLTDKEDGVRGASAVALGEIGDSDAVIPLSTILGSPIVVSGSKKKSKPRKEQNPFVLRSAARSLGQIGNSAAAPALIAVLGDEKAESDLRREVAIALGKIGAPSALPALNAALTSVDPYLVAAASEAIQRISRHN